MGSPVKSIVFCASGIRADAVRQGTGKGKHDFRVTDSDCPYPGPKQPQPPTAVNWTHSGS